MSMEWVPADWRNKCTVCGRFLAADSYQGTTYTPYGPNLEYDDYTECFACKHCDANVTAELVVTRVELVDLDTAVVW